MLLFGIAISWLQCAVSFISSRRLTMYRLNSSKLQLGWVAKQQPGILYSDIYSPWKLRLPLLFWYASISCIYLHFDVEGQFLPFKYYICGQNRASLEKLLFLSIPSFSLLNWFRIKTILCHNECSIITSFELAALKVPIIVMFLREHWSINWNDLKKLPTERSIGFRLPSELTDKPLMMSSTTPAASPKLVTLSVSRPVLLS